MNEQNLAIDDAQMAEVVPGAADNDSVETQQAEQSEAVEQSTGDPRESDNEEEVVFPKKAINAINRRDKKINRLNAQLKELEAKLSQSPEVKTDHKVINPDDFENYGDYINAQIESAVEQRTKQSTHDMQQTQLKQQQDNIKAQRQMYVIEQAQEAAKSIPDLPQVWQENAQTLDALPKEIEEIFYSLDNAPAAIYALAKEGKLDSLAYTNPYIAAQEIYNAQNKGMQLMQKPQPRISQTPTPIEKAKGTGTVKKQLTPQDDILKSLGLK